MRGGREIFVVHELQPRVAREAFGPFGDEQDVRGAFHDGAREQDRIFDVVDVRRRARRAGAAIHDRGVQVEAAIHVAIGSLARIELSAILQRAHGGRDGIEARAAAPQNFVADAQRGVQRVAHGALLFGGENGGPARVGPTVDDEGNVHRPDSGRRARLCPTSRRWSPPVCPRAYGFDDETAAGTPPGKNEQTSSKGNPFFM